MKTFWNGFKKSRLYQYLIYGFLYLMFWEFLGFELTVITIMSTVLGEIHYQFKERGKS